MRSLGQTIGVIARAHNGRLSALRRPPAVLTNVTAFGANPGSLSMLVHVPRSLGPNAPLVVVLHGCTQSAEGYADGAGWIEAADRFGFALLCPEQTPNNNPNVCFNWFVPADTRRGGGEAASIANMIAHMIAAHDLDPGRIYITGLSAGGAMANVMLATYPELFRGGAIIAGLSYGSAGNVQEAFAAMAHQHHESDQALGDKVRSAARAHQGPWPKISVWHGDRDATVAPEAGEAIVRQWVNVHRAAPAPAQLSGPSRRREWRSPDGSIAVEHHAIPGMGHGAPLRTTGADALGRKGPYLLDVGVSSTLEILKSWDVLPQADQRQVGPRPEFEVSEVAAIRKAPRLDPAGRPQTIDVGEVINSALRAAGLLK